MKPYRQVHLSIENLRCSLGSAGVRRIGGVYPRPNQAQDVVEAGPADDLPYSVQSVVCARARIVWRRLVSPERSDSWDGAILRHG